MKQIIFYSLIILFSSCGNSKKENNQKYEPIQKPEQKTVFVQNGDTIAKLLSKEYPNIINLWTHEIINDKDLIGKISTELDLGKGTVFLFEKDNSGEDYYAYFDGNHLHRKITNDEIVTELIDEINSFIKSYSINDFSEVNIFLTRVEKYNEDLSKYSESKGYSTLKKSIVNFQKKYFPVARNIYYKHSKEALWEKNIEVLLSRKNITYIGYMFADNGTIKATFEGINAELRKLRFQRVSFKWYDDSETTYYTLNSKKDEDIITE